MKKSLIFFPVFMLLLGGCGTKSETSSSEAPVNPTSSVAPAGPSSVAPTSSQGPSVSPDPSSEVPPSSSADPVVNKYTVTWKDGNDQVIETDTEVVEGTTPSYDGATPTKAADAAATYVFNGNWLPAVGPVTSDVTYVAQFNSAPRQYTITWLDGNGVELKHESVAYGETPEYTGAAPTKNSTAQYSYTWNNGWDPAISAVVGDQTYTATFDQATRKYTVRFIDGDGVELSSEQLDYGATPAYAGSDPTKSQTDEFTYAWDGTWTPAIGEVSGDVDYVANFTPTTRQYTIRFIDGDGNAISTQSVNYGELPDTAGLAPTKTEDAAKTYNWNGGWQPAVHNCNGDQDYVATFEENVRQYTIRFFDGDGNKIGEGLWDYGSTPAYEGADPEKSSTVDTVYTWTGEWSPAIKAVDGNQDYVATFNDSAREYTIRFIDGDGNVLDTQSLEYGVTPAYVGADPTKASTAEHTYSWNGGWSPAISAVDGDVDYTATFGESVRKYNVRFYNGEDLVKTEQVDYGSTATAPTEDPTKVDSDYKYTFTGWDADLSQPITGDLDVHAEYSKLKYRQEVETFEHFEVSNELADEGWFVTTWKDDHWDKENKASLSLSKNAAEGQQALRLNAFRGNGFKILKEYSQENPNPATERANAFKFSLKAPTGALKAPNGALKPAPRLTLFTDIPNPFPANNDPVYLKYDIPMTSAEYVDYTIPFAAAGWTVFDTAMNLYDVGSQAGIDIDSLPSHITSFEIYLTYDAVSPSEYYAFLDDVAWVTTEETTVQKSESFEEYLAYTGTTNSGHTFKFDITGVDEGVARIIDIETPVAIQGSYEIDGNHLTFNSFGAGQLSYEGTLTDGAQKVEFGSVSSSLFPELETELDGMDLRGVQIVDNYEQYSAAGKAYSQKYSEAQREGMRGEYYSEYYANSGSSPWGGNKWSLMGGEADQMDLNTDATYVHGGAKSIKLKAHKDMAMRYMSWGIFKGTSDNKAYRGTELSVWVKAAGTVNNVKLYAFSKADCTMAESADASFCKTTSHTTPLSTSEWTRLTVALNPNIVYYGFGIMIDKNNVATTYLYVDDVEVYGANPYAKYEAPTDAELRVGKVYAGKAGGVVNTLLTIKEGNNARLQIPSLLINLPATYSTSLDEVTFNFSGATYVGTVSADGSAIAFKSITGSSAVAQVLNGTSFGESYVCETAEGYSESGKMYYQSSGEDARSGARGAYFCDYYSGGSGSPVGGTGWSLMGGSGDQLSLNKSAYYEGSQSLDMKFSTNGTMRYLQWDLYKGTAKPITGVSSFTVYAKNISGYDAQINVQVFTTPQVTPSNQGTARVALGDTYIDTGTDWTAYTVTLNPASTYYGFGIVLKAVGSTSGHIRGTGFLQVDGAHYNKADYDYEWSVLPKKDLTLSGKLPIGDASFKFGDPGKGLFNCATASMTDVATTYSMRMNAGVQEMTLTVGETVVVGEYSFDSSTQKVKFTVISATGTYAAAFPANTVFTN